MPVTLDTSPYDLPAGALLRATLVEDAHGTRSLVAQLRKRIENARVEQEGWSRRFDQLYDKARESNWNVPFLTRWAAALLEKQRAALERFQPEIEELERKAAISADRSDPELLGLLLATISLVLGWISPYQTLAGRLLDLASERAGRGSDEILRARPVAGPVDHAALSREHMARYPKIRAALAE